MPTARAIPERETLSVEFKSDLKRLPDSELIDTVVALSNSEGGQIYLGVEDDGRPTGVHSTHADVTQLAALIANKTIPPVAARITTLHLSPDGTPDDKGCQVTLVEIPKSLAIVASTNGKIMRRRFTSDGSPESAPLYPYEIITRLTTLGQMDYSAFPVPDTTSDDFDPDEIRRLRDNLAKQKSADHLLLELPDNELLDALQMTTRVDGRITPTVTGLLLAGKPTVIKRAIPAATASFQVLDGTEVRVNTDIDRALLGAIDKIDELFQPWNPEREFEDGLLRVPVPEFDRRAFREALVNAFGHRDYAALGAVRVQINDEGLVVANPGGFIEGISVDNLLSAEPRGRNQCLMSALKRIGLAEKTGRGIDRIYEGSLAYGRPLPDYSSTTPVCVSVFIARSAPDGAFMRMISDEQARIGKPLSLRALLALDALKRQRRLTVADLARHLQSSMPVARSTVESLVEANLVEAYGTSSSRSYTLSSRVYKAAGKEAHFVLQSDIDRVRFPELIMKLAKQKGFLTTHDVEKLLHVSNKQAYRLITKLVEEGSLHKEGIGKAMRYVP